MGGVEAFMPPGLEGTLTRLPLGQKLLHFCMLLEQVHLAGTAWCSWYAQDMNTPTTGSPHWPEDSSQHDDKQMHEGSAGATGALRVSRVLTRVLCSRC